MKYITGSGQRQETVDRVLIYDKEGNVKRHKRDRMKQSSMQNGVLARKQTVEKRKHDVSNVSVGNSKKKKCSSKSSKNLMQQRQNNLQFTNTCQFKSDIEDIINNSGQGETGVAWKSAVELARESFGLANKSSRGDVLKSICLVLQAVMNEWPAVETHWSKYDNSNFLTNYPEFEHRTKDEQEKLCVYANWMRFLIKENIVAAPNNKGLLMNVVTETAGTMSVTIMFLYKELPMRTLSSICLVFAEGDTVKYITGSGQRQETEDRVLIYDKEGNVKRHKRNRTKRAGVTEGNYAAESDVSLYLSDNTRSEVDEVMPTTTFFNDLDVFDFRDDVASGFDDDHNACV